MPAWKFWLPITPVHVLVLFFHLQPFQKNPAQQILPKCCHMDAFSPKFHLTCLALCLEGFLFLNILNILEYFICRPCLGFYFNIIPYSNQFPSLNHHIGIKDTHTFSGSSTLLLPITDFSTDQNLQLSHSSPKSFKTRIWNVWHNLTPIEYLADSSSHGQHWVVPLTSMKCGCTASPPADQGSIPCLQIPGKPLSWWIINIPRCLQRCRAAAVLPTVLWQEIFYPPAAVPTFPECLGSVKAGFLTLHLAWAPGRGTNRLTAGAVWPAPTSLAEHTGMSPGVSPAQTEMFHEQNIELQAQPQHGTVKVPAQVSSDGVWTSNTNKTEGSNTLEGGSEKLDSCLHSISFPHRDR